MTQFFHQINSLAPDWIKQQHVEFRRFVKFFIVGGIGAVIDFSVLNILVFAFGVPKIYANLISVSCAIVSNFTWNRLWTFPESREHAVHHQFLQFALVNLVGLGINTAVFLLADQYLWLPLLPHHVTIALNLAKACAVGVVLFWNFGVNRVWTYRHIK